MLRKYFLLLLACPMALPGDGGMVILHREAPPFVITVFASPAPPHAGTVDLSVLVQAGEALEPVLDADVHFILTHRTSTTDVRATRGQAQNKLLYAAPAHLEESGDWTYFVSVRNDRMSATLPGTLRITANPPEAAVYWPVIVLPLVCIILFTLNQIAQRRLPAGKQ